MAAQLQPSLCFDQISTPNPRSLSDASSSSLRAAHRAAKPERSVSQSKSSHVREFLNRQSQSVSYSIDIVFPGIKTSIVGREIT